MTPADLRARAETIWEIVQAQSVAAGDEGALILKNEPGMAKILKASFIHGYIAGATDKHREAA